MATTVFPVTDQVVTTTLWNALHSAIDRGSPLTGFLAFAGTEDTNYLKYNRPFVQGFTTSGTTQRTYCTISLDAGGIYHVTGMLVMNKTADTTDDQCSCGFKMDPGIEWYFACNKSVPFVGSGRTTFVANGDETFSDLDDIYRARGTHGVNYTDEPVFILDMIAVVNQDADLSFSYAKTTNTYATTYQPPGNRSYLKAVRIF